MWLTIELAILDAQRSATALKTSIVICSKSQLDVFLGGTVSDPLKAHTCPCTSETFRVSHSASTVKLISSSSSTRFLSSMNWGQERIQPITYFGEIVAKFFCLYALQKCNCLVPTVAAMSFQIHLFSFLLDCQQSLLCKKELLAALSQIWT